MADYYLSFQRDVEDLLKAVEYLTSASPAQEAILLFRAAQTLELMGDYSRSRDFYLKASETTDEMAEKTWWLMEAAGLSLLMGETAQGEALLLKILPQCEPGEQKAEALLLLSRLFFYQDREPESLKALQDSLSEKILPETLYWQESLNQTGSNAGNEAQGLSVVFPESLSTLLQRGEVMGKTEPIYLGLASPEETEPENPSLPKADEDQSAPGPAETGAIQAGSFVDEENARELQKDLEKIGYLTEIRITERNDRTYHQVLIVGIEKSVLREELNKLRTRGYDGFITQ